MKWLPGGWQRADPPGAERPTVPRGPAEQGTVKHPPKRPSAQGPATRVYGRDGGRPEPPPKPTLLGDQAQDVDVSATLFRNLLIGGGVSGFLTVLCAASLANQGSGVWVWIWQIVFGVLFLWFVFNARGVLKSRGFLFDRSGFYARTTGEVVGVPWEEISAVGVGSLPLIEQNRPVSPERRHAFELFPADAGFVERHPEWERWLVEERPPMPDLPGVRYRFHLPPFSRLARELEQAAQANAPRKWVGHYRRVSPPQQ